MENELNVKSSIPLKHLLSLMLAESRDESKMADDFHSVNRDARRLMIALEKSQPPDQITVANILSQSSFSHIKLVSFGSRIFIQF